MKRNRRWLVVLGIVIVAGLLFDGLAAVRPAMPPVREGEVQLPDAEDEPFSREPIAATFEERRQLYYDWASGEETSDERGGLWTDIVKLQAGAASVSSVALQAALDFVNERQDPSDFAMTSLIRLYYLEAGSGKLTSDQEAAIKEAILNSKYWPDEPGKSYVEMWTENHQILNHSNEYLAGQMFPDEIFSNNGETGAWHMAHARELFLEWIDLRAKAGFSEWDSETYYPEDLAPLLNLVDFSQDDEVATLAAMLADVILFDIEVDSFYGHYATSAGRITPGSIQSQKTSVTTIAALAWGQGRFTTTSNMGAAALATTQKYEIPPVIQAIAYDNPEKYLNYERHSFDIVDAADFGLDITDINDVPRLWGMGAFSIPEMIYTTIATADEWELWHYPDFRDLKDIAKVLQAVNGLSVASRWLVPDSNGVYMGKVNKVTYRTPDYMLSSAQSFRPGEKGYQQHIWQATLSPYAVVFTTNPDSLRTDDKQRPSYWMGNGRQPRTAQFENVLIALYDIPRYPSAPAPLEMRHYAFTHAYFPQWAFDEVVEQNGWVFGRLGDGYIALYSDQPYQWVTEGPDANQEIAAPGYKNVWVTIMGRESVDGSFQDFIDSVVSLEINIKGLDVSFEAPGQGLVEFGWESPLVVGGQEIPLDGYLRFDNPYAQVPFGQSVYEIEFDGKSLYLDFEHGIREFE